MDNATDSSDGVVTPLPHRYISSMGLPKDLSLLFVAMVPSLKFNPDLAQVWPPARIAGGDNSESMVQQYLHHIKQSREFPWYSLFPGTVMPHLRAIYSCGKSDLRLECSPQYELHYDINLTPEEADEATDPSYQQPGPSSGTLGNDPFDRQPSTSTTSATKSTTSATKSEKTRELEALLKSTAGLDGRAWRATINRDSRAKKAASDKKPEVSRPPDSNTSASTAAEGIFARIIRITDGMFTIRAKLVQYQTMHPETTEVPDYPALSVEIKPLELCEKMKEAAQRALDKAMSQIVQQAQFIFGMWGSLKVIWMLGVCGRWVQFLKFTKARTPLPDPTKICNQEYYEPGPLLAYAVPQETSPVFAFMDEDGKYTDEFMRYWRRVMKDAETEYNAYIKSL